MGVVKIIENNNDDSQDDRDIEIPPKLFLSLRSLVRQKNLADLVD